MIQLPESIQRISVNEKQVEILQREGNDPFDIFSIACEFSDIDRNYIRSEKAIIVTSIPTDLEINAMTRFNKEHYSLEKMIQVISLIKGHRLIGYKQEAPTIFQDIVADSNGLVNTNKTALSFGYHTDNAFIHAFPDIRTDTVYLASYSNPAEDPTLLKDLNDIIDNLDLNFIEILMSQGNFSMKNSPSFNLNGHRTLSPPTALLYKENGIYKAALSLYGVVPLNENAEKAFSAFCAALEQAPTYYIPLMPGEVLAFDNNTWLHGRAPIKDLKRYLIRAYGNAYMLENPNVVSIIDYLFK